jgi:hypothetical protein
MREIDVIRNLINAIPTNLSTGLDILRKDAFLGRFRKRLGIVTVFTGFSAGDGRRRHLLGLSVTVETS